MDLPVQWALGLVHGLLPSTTIEFINQNILAPSSPVQSLRRTAVATASSASRQMWPVVAPLADRLMQALYASPDIVVLIVFLFILLVAVQILNWTRRVMMCLTVLAFRLAFYAGLVALAAAVWQRGLEASVRDAVVVGSKLYGYAMGLKDVFVREYQRYEAQQAQAAAGGGGGSYGRRNY
ncbi:hypothetical protein B0H66DRAFT_611936 [Apodospora peruviana]|uniref:Nuclear pore assembly and biogenesis-domain-containing protein n=1 Tax=Apodospora peruviana TaxID=516989 RepID=A0AAE0ISD6_9PEZI|nr:hypothetical protein B0H66DRAFT_611936 [Apodospora peruviana]